MSLQQQMRDAMIADGRSRYRLSKETGVAAETLSRFYHGERGLSAAAMEKLADALGLELQPVKPARAKRKAGKASKPKAGRKGKAKRKATKRTPKRKGE